METLQVRPSDSKDIVLRAMKASRPIFLWGPPGIGKSELVEQIVDSGELGNAYMIDMRLALMEPTDLVILVLVFSCQRLSAVRLFLLITNSNCA